MVSLFPARVRVSGISFTYNIAYAAWASITPLLLIGLMPESWDLCDFLRGDGGGGRKQRGILRHADAENRKVFDRWCCVNQQHDGGAGTIFVWTKLKHSSEKTPQGRWLGCKSLTPVHRCIPMFNKRLKQELSALREESSSLQQVKESLKARCLC